MACCNNPRTCENFDDDREGVADADLARFGGDDIECPNCGTSLYHDASQCHDCGHAMTDASLKKRVPVWIPLAAAGAALGLILIYVTQLM